MSERRVNSFSTDTNLPFRKSLEDIVEYFYFFIIFIFLILHLKYCAVYPEMY